MGRPKRKSPATAAVAAEDSTSAASASENAGPGRRVTRGLTRQLQNSGGDSLPKPPPPQPKKEKKEKTTKKAKKDADADAHAVEDNSKTTNTATTDKSDTTTIDDVNKAVVPTLVIEHCKQCHRFKVRAVQVQKGLEEGVPGITVLINPEKPRRGCFEIRLEGGQTFISLLDMKRPFKPLTDLNMENVIADIIEKVKA